DYGQVGVEDTINCLAGKIYCVGGGKTLAEARAILYKQIGGKAVAIINFCENEWSIARKDRGGSNPMNVITNFNDIRTAREESDLVVVIVHGGVEHYSLPTPRMKELYRFYIDAGADVVINHHQHCFSGWMKKRLATIMLQHSECK
ncbi:MAG: CapA family protein, partial [Oscillospiraceae bacterium]|nr:CapA family protein [Oscillospiraceae bacterium]